MTCRRVQFGDTVGIVTFADIYTFGGFTFEWHSFCGPMKCRKDGEPSEARAGARFYDAAAKWHKLPKVERETYRLTQP